MKTQGARNGIQKDNMTETKVIGHLNDEDAEGIQGACRGCAKRNLANGRFLVTGLQQKRLVLIMF